MIGIVELEACLKIERKIELRAFGNVDGNRSDGSDEPRGRCDDRLQSVLAQEIKFQAERIQAAAVNRLVARLAEAGGKDDWIRVARDVSWLAQNFDWDDVERVFERTAARVENQVTVPKSEDAQLSIAGDADQMRVAGGSTAPDAEFAVALPARNWRESGGGYKQC